MTGPAPQAHVPVWLSTDDVLTQLHIYPVAADVRALVQECAAAVEPAVQRYRYDGWDASTPRVYVPAVDVYRGAVLMAARLFRRRNAPVGNETFGESVAYVVNRDPETQELLRTGPWLMPQSGGGVPA